MPQYKLTLDGGTLKSDQIQYKIENSGNFLNQTSTSVNEEVLKLKQKPGLIVKKENPQFRLTATSQISNDDSRNKKPKINFVLQTTPQKQQLKSQQISSPPKSVTFTSPAKAQILNIEKISPVTSQASATKQVIVPIMVRSDSSRNTISTSGSDAAAQILQQALQFSANQVAMNTVAVENKTNNQPFMFMKLQQNSDGQFTMVPASAPAPIQPPPPPPPQQHLQISLSSQQLQQLGLQATTSNQPTQQQHTITVQQAQLTSQVATPRAVTPQQQQQQQQQIEEIEIESVKDIVSTIEIGNDDEIYNDSYDDENDYYGDDNESDNNESHEKLTSDKKLSTTPKKKSQKSVKQSSKTKSSDIYEEPIINPEHSEKAKKQLNLLTSFNTKKSVEEENKNEINLTVCDVSKKKLISLNQ